MSPAGGLFKSLLALAAVRCSGEPLRGGHDGSYWRSAGRWERSRVPDSGSGGGLVH